ncbi:12765_t:CDS:2 [Rhizophagus irregularis]|nr:12765_t:CDS:2 [Rhizophagus irregularis]
MRKKNTELKIRVAKLEQDSKQPQNDSHVEEAVVIPESVSIQLNQHTPVCKAGVSEKPSANVIVPER